MGFNVSIEAAIAFTSIIFDLAVGGSQMPIEAAIAFTSIITTASIIIKSDEIADRIIAMFKLKTH